MSNMSGKIMWLLLLTAGLVAFARFMHPATFSAHMFPFLIAVSFLAGVIYLYQQPHE